VLSFVRRSLCVCVRRQLSPPERAVAAVVPTRVVLALSPAAVAVLAQYA